MALDDCARTGLGSEIVTTASEVVPDSILENEPAPHRGLESTAETAECTCPEFCERDHDID
jgi:hypothetical protein